MKKGIRDRIGVKKEEDMQWIQDIELSCFDGFIIKSNGFKSNQDFANFEAAYKKLLNSFNKKRVFIHQCAGTSAQVTTIDNHEKVPTIFSGSVTRYAGEYWDIDREKGRGRVTARATAEEFVVNTVDTQLAVLQHECTSADAQLPHTPLSLIG